MNFVDIHCHLLWGVDDGCRTAEDSVEMARVLVELGYTEVAPSPHARAEFPSGDAALCSTRREEVARLLEGRGIKLLLHAGAENYLDDELIHRIDRGEPRGIGARQRYALIELPHRSAMPALPAMLFRIQLKGVSPILAHPERCLEFETEGRAAEAVRLGAALQLDVGALTGRYGKGARKLAERFLADGLYSIAATDLHGPSGAREWVSAALAALEGRAGASEVARLCDANPRRAVAGEDLQ